MAVSAAPGWVTAAARASPNSSSGIPKTAQSATPGIPAARSRSLPGRCCAAADVMSSAVDDGFLFIVDRQSDMVISGGVNIYPVEIEIALQGMPGVADCAVFGIPDDEFGEALAAAVQPAPGAALTAESVRAWLHERIAGYKVPKVVSLHEQLPREDTGKLFKRKLREPYWVGRARRV